MQQQQCIHSDILNGITDACLDDKDNVNEASDNTNNNNGTGVCLQISNAKNTGLRWWHPIDRRSLQHLVDFLSLGEQQQQQPPPPPPQPLPLAGVVVTELQLLHVNLVSDPCPDGGVNVLRDFFARSDTTLTKVMLRHCNFGNAQEASRLVTAFQSNRTVVDLEIKEIQYVDGPVLGTCLSSIVQNNVIQRLKCSLCITSDSQILPAMQHGLSANTSLKELDLSNCFFGDEGMRLLADALVGNNNNNTTIETLKVGNNLIKSTGLADITRILESTQIKTIDFGNNHRVFYDDDDSFDAVRVQHFCHVLSFRAKFVRTLYMNGVSTAPAMIFQALEHNTVLEYLHMGRLGPATTTDGRQQHGVDQLIDSLPRIKGLRRLELDHADLLRLIQHSSSFQPALLQNTSIEEFPGLDVSIRTVQFSLADFQAAIETIHGILARNCTIGRADSLLALQPRTGLPIASKSCTWPMAFAKWGSIVVGGVPHTSGRTSVLGASAIFKILSKRPAILEKQLRRPAAIAAAVSTDNNDNRGGCNHSLEADTQTGGQKCQRLL